MAFTALIVDDDQSFAKMISIRLQSWKSDIQILMATSLQQAREVLDAQKKPIPLAILDQHLPDGLGYEISSHPALKETTILAVSADETPELPGQTVLAGAKHCLGKRQVTTPLFIPLIEAMLERTALEKKLREGELNATKMQTIKTLLATLRHEINNPLGAVLGATYLLQQQEELDEKQVEAIQLIERSGHRIKHVLQQLCEAAELEEVVKAHEQVYHVPGDTPWKGGQEPEE